MAARSALFLAARYTVATSAHVLTRLWLQLRRALLARRPGTVLAVLIGSVLGAQMQLRLRPSHCCVRTYICITSSWQVSSACPPEDARCSTRFIERHAEHLQNARTTITLGGTGDGRAAYRGATAPRHDMRFPGTRTPPGTPSPPGKQSHWHSTRAHTRRSPPDDTSMTTEYASRCQLDVWTRSDRTTHVGTAAASRNLSPLTVPPITPGGATHVTAHNAQFAARTPSDRHPERPAITGRWQGGRSQVAGRIGSDWEKGSSSRVHRAPLGSPYWIRDGGLPTARARVRLRTTPASSQRDVIFVLGGWAAAGAVPRGLSVPCILGGPRCAGLDL
ncbi:hypothetical protein C8Q73DRAFT_176340 [Cubamyces lactineus]|nr:hypothetical protein C8Q73DRAFT_176340 [Cubamyces lactineus]